MEFIKPYWPDWLKDAVATYRPDDPASFKKRDRLEKTNDIGHLYHLKEEDIPLLNDVWAGMGDVYEIKAGTAYLTDEQKLIYSYRSKPGDKFQNLPHISTLLEHQDPFKTFRSKYPALYRTMIIWMWG